MNADVASETYRLCILQSLKVIEKVWSGKVQHELKAKWRDAEGRKVAMLPAGGPSFNSRKKATKEETISNVQK